jgi:hypothetical protein
MDEFYSEAVCRTPSPDRSGEHGAPGRMESSGAGGSGGVAQAAAKSSECLEEVLTAVGSCAATLLLHAGARALLAGVDCAGSTLTAIECLKRDAEADKR